MGCEGKQKEYANKRGSKVAYKNSFLSYGCADALAVLIQDWTVARID